MNKAFHGIHEAVNAKPTNVQSKNVLHVHA